MNLRIKLDLVGLAIKLKKNNSLGAFYKVALQSSKPKMKSIKTEKLLRKLVPSSCLEVIEIEQLMDNPLANNLRYLH